MNGSRVILYCDAQITRCRVKISKVFYIAAVVVLSLCYTRQVAPVICALKSVQTRSCGPDSADTWSDVTEYGGRTSMTDLAVKDG